jgi:hypothetical protein
VFGQSGVDDEARIIPDGKIRFENDLRLVSGWMGRQSRTDARRAQGTDPRW